jgi:hypothetical protein
MADCCKHGNEFSGSIKGRDFFHRLTNLFPCCMYSLGELSSLPLRRNAGHLFIAPC